MRHFTLRPSKNFQFDLLSRKIETRKGAIGVDAAAANMKNRPWFKTDAYYGIDLDLAMLQRGLERFSNDPSVFAVHADLAHLEALGTGSVDVLISTNTLYHLSDTNRLTAISHLARLVKPKGFFAIELPTRYLNADAQKIISTQFRNIETIYFRNPLSRAYESFFERNGELGSHPIAGTKPFRLLAWCIGKLEYLTCRFSKINQQAIVIATEKIDQTTQPFLSTPTARVIELATDSR